MLALIFIQHITIRIVVSAHLFVALPARATAGTGNPTLTTGDAPDSICPYGWKLPGYDGSGSYYDLNQKYTNKSGNHNSNTFIQMLPLSFTRSGLYIDDTGYLGFLASRGDFWSRTPHGKSRAYLLTFYPSIYLLYPQNDDERGDGFSIRCLVALPARATAGTGNPTLTTGDAPDSICPYGWRLPTGDSKNGSYRYLMADLYRTNQKPNPDTAMVAAPISLTRAGDYGTNAPSWPNWGYYRMSTVKNNEVAYMSITSLYNGKYSIPERFSSNPGAGHTLRCLAR